MAGTELRKNGRVEKKLGALTVREIEATDVVALIEGAGLTWGESNMLLITSKCEVHARLRQAADQRQPLPRHHAFGAAGRTATAPPAPDADARGTEAAAGRAHASPELDDWALAIRILLATAVRSAELYQAQWADVDLDGAQWHIPKSKTGAAMDIPLAPVVVDWFRELRTLAGNSAYVLPAHSRSRAARHGGDTHLNNDTMREAIAHWLRTATPAVRRFTPHDLRSTVKSHLRALGVPRDISEMCLNHRLSGVEGIYDRHTYFEERREALGKWAGVLALMKLTSSDARVQSVAAASPAA